MNSNTSFALLWRKLARTRPSVHIAIAPLSESAACAAQLHAPLRACMQPYSTILHHCTLSTACTVKAGCALTYTSSTAPRFNTHSDMRLLPALQNCRYCWRSRAHVVFHIFPGPKQPRNSPVMHGFFKHALNVMLPVQRRHVVQQSLLRRRSRSKRCSI